MDVESKETIDAAINAGKAAADELVDHVATRLQAATVDLLARAEAAGQRLIDHTFAKLQGLVNSFDEWSVTLLKPDNK